MTLTLTGLVVKAKRLVDSFDECPMPLVTFEREWYYQQQKR
jgi:hypothetical protein